VTLFLLKGLWRDRTRSLFPFVTVVTGVMLTVLLQSYMTGVAANMSQATAAFSTGHVKVTSRPYAREAAQSPNELAMTGVEALLAAVRAAAPEMAWTPRVRFGGLLDVPDATGGTLAQSPVFGLALALRSHGGSDRRTLNLAQAIVRGRLPEQANEILVSDDLATHLNVGPGATATLVSSTMHGGMATQNFTIAGTVRFGVRAMDRGTMLADVEDVQRALDMEDAAGELVGVFPDMLYREAASDRIAGRLNEGWAAATDPFAPFAMPMSGQPGGMELIGYIGSVSAAVITVFTLVMSIVLWNSGLVGSLRRYGEIGLRLACGEHNGHLYRMMLVESIAIGLAGSVAGTLLALAPAYYLQSKGFDIGSVMPNASLMINTSLRAQITGTTFVIGFLPGLLATSLGTAISGIGIYRRQTATLLKELEA
jgi:putative ABC transport system permease protein